MPRYLSKMYILICQRGRAAMEPTIITLTCPSCGGKLEITNEIDRFACGYCGVEHIVNRGGGIVSLKPVLESLQDVKIGVDRTAAELAIPRLESEISELTARLRTLETGYLPSILGALIGILLAALLSLLFNIDWGIQYILFATAGFFVGDRIRARNNKPRIESIKSEIIQKKKQLAEHKRKV
jgi:predicted RNA-binding Zn-ribbon protein involved in translation (DUF1610 family)